MRIARIESKVIVAGMAACEETVTDHQLQIATTSATCILALLAVITWAQMRTSAERQLRAYLGVSFRWASGAGDFNMDFNWAALHTGLFVSNHGQTPARNVCFRGACKVLPQSPSTDKIRLALLEAGTSAPQTSNPGGLPLYFLVQADGRAQPEADGERLYAFGTIDYDDAFGVTRFTHFCVYWDEERKQKTGGGWVPADIHNDAT